MDIELFLSELSYRTARSGGSGGQHVNKVESKVEARWSIDQSMAVDEAEKALIRERLAAQITTENELILTHQTERSQYANKEKVKQRILKLVQKALVRPKKRKPTAVPASVKAARIVAKRRLSEKKAERRKGGDAE